ncbi:hypothetical protein LAZ67_18001365 [Cordylochernes scorpioides]|uniref:RNA-directed DNA polymerase n=1 Tax=Cordylochernes scorpioides TaxID=51811 RepID=A0ABY6LFQ8_9ARAC|nr:hypothetical protein LAZ67_18001365 [Cordylochernes scorpioides]
MAWEQNSHQSAGRSDRGKPFPSRNLLVPFLLDVRRFLVESLFAYSPLAQLCRLPPRLHGRVDIEDCGRQGTSKQVDHCLYRKMEQGRGEDSKEPMESDPDYETGKNTTFPKLESTLGRTQEVPPSHEGATPPPAVSDVLGSLTRTLHQLFAATGQSRDVELPRYDGSYEAQSFFDNYDAQADLAQLQYTERFRRLPNLLQDDQNNAQPFLRTVTEVQCSATVVSATQLRCQSTPFILQSRPRPVYRATTYPQHERTVLSSPAPFRVNNTLARVTRSPDPLYTKSPAQAVNPSCPMGTSTTPPKQACSDPQDSTTDGLPCRLYCDASTQGIAGILKQVHPDGKIHPTQYCSRALRPHERNYTISELECLAIVESIEKFRIYLFGTKFTVYSDHQALQWLKTIKNPSGRLFRWSLRLSTYEYEIQYLKGTQQHEADLLSRNPFCGFISARTIKKHQPNITDISVAVYVNGLHTIRHKAVNRIIIPETLQHSLMTQVHSEYNHPGISQMARLISTQYYWKGMAKSIQKFVNSCHTCQIIKRPKGNPYGTLGQIPPPQQPFDLISIDTIFGFLKYGHSKTYLHVIVDHLTRYAWACPSKYTSTLTYIQTLKKVLQQGSPKRLLLDRAPAFTSEIFRKFLLSRGIQPLITTSNNPQANGLIERLNATITGKLSIPPELKNHYNPFPDVQKARQLAFSRTQLKHERDKQKYDKGHQAPHFEIGDLVLVNNYKHPDTGKLAPYFTGMPSHRRSNLSQRSKSSRVQHAYRLRETRAQNIRRLREQSARQATLRLSTTEWVHLCHLRTSQVDFFRSFFMGNDDDDDAIQTDRRCQQIQGVRRNIVQGLQRMLHQHNLLVQQFKTALENLPSDAYSVVVNANRTPPGQHPRRYNAPTANEVAVVLAGNQFGSRDIVLRQRDNVLQHVSDTHRFYDALQYPLNIWKGQEGYSFYIPQIDPNTRQPLSSKVSSMDFYGYFIMVRRNSPNVIAQFGQLFHQFLVDMYAKVENERLRYITLHQRNLRAESYIHLRDALSTDANINPNSLGQRIILPSSFVNSPRYLAEYTQDAFCYVRKFERPDLFITFTSNPSWKEISAALLPGQKQLDRHDITARVFGKN